MPQPDCTICDWCYHPPMEGSTEDQWHIRIPNLGCPTHPWPLPPPGCGKCKWDPVTMEWIHPPDQTPPGPPCPYHP